MPSGIYERDKRQSPTYRYVYGNGGKRGYRVIVNGIYAGTRSSMIKAARLADETIIALEKEHDNHIGRWPLNFPDEWPSVNSRRMQFALERGDFYELYGQYLTDYVRSEQHPTKAELVWQNDFKEMWKNTFASAKNIKQLCPNGVVDFLAIAEHCDRDLFKTRQQVNRLLSEM